MKHKAEDNAHFDKEAELTEKVEKLLGPTPEKAPAKSIAINHITDGDSAPGAPAVGTDSPEPAPAAQPVEVPPKDQTKTDEDQAIDDIAAKDADELLEAEDKEKQEVEKAFDGKKKDFKTKLKDFFSNWWNNPKYRWATIAALALLIITVLGLPWSRYFVLNTAGVRSSASIIILDDSTKLPLKNVSVTFGKQSALTDSDGKATLTHLRLGSQQGTIQKRAFAPISKKVIVGWGSNPLGNLSLTPVGAQYAFLVTDWLSGKPIEGAEASANEANALSDKNGKILLTLDKNDASDATVNIKADTYRDEQAHISASTTGQQAVKMVSGHKHAFVSKRSGKYDVYKIDADGQHEEVALAGTGLERNDITLIANPNANVAALVSTRDNVRNKDGYLLSTLTMINLDDNQTTRVVQSERIQLVNWVGDKLVYAQIAASASAANPHRYRLVAYDYKKPEAKELAASNYFNDVMVLGGNVYYAPSSSYGNMPHENFYKINTDGTGKQTILDQEVWNIFRADYDKLVLSMDNAWYEYKLNGKPTKLAGEPASTQNRVYVDSPDGKYSVWIDTRDGKGVLILYDTKSKTEKVIRSQSGLRNPIHWLSNNTLVYRINTDQETADYVLNIDGGEPHKIKDVTNTTGIDQWYYY
ncbi:MAG: hypothetical protein JWS12_201 [Candidatus Saccharibacteria bacterium]|nr:hypothetical protein [Candidatus Saccharibacteria bacterium]